jgi:DNA-binding IclR family transcriptional regulator
MHSTKIVNTISRGAEILKIISEGYTRLEDIYPKVCLSKSTTHRILTSLVFSGFAFQSPVNRNYYLGPLFLRLSSKPTVAHQMLILSSVNGLRRLRDASGETTLMMIPNGDQKLVLKEVRSKQKIALSLGNGSTVPLYVGSSGRILLSQYTDKDLDQIFGKMNMVPVSPNTITEKNLLKKEIYRIRKKGFATSSGEMLPDSAGISVPVKGYFCPVALCVIGPKFRFKPLSILDELNQTATRISERLLLSEENTRSIR